MNKKPRKFIEPGKIVGRLKYTGVWKHFETSIKWQSHCECEKIHWVSSSHIPKTNSCGCVLANIGRNAKVASRGKFILNAFLQRFKFGAKSRKIEFSLTMEQIEFLWEKQGGKCFYTGVCMTLPKYASDCTKVGKYNASIDRIDSKLGYIINNVVFCLKDINKMKMDFEQEKFLELCRQIASIHSSSLENIASKQSEQTWEIKSSRSPADSSGIAS